MGEKPAPRVMRKGNSDGVIFSRERGALAAVFFVSVNAVAQIVWFPAAPLWAFLMILLDVAIIYQLTARWEE